MRRGYLVLSLALALLPACSDSSTEFWPGQNSLLAMVALENRVAYVETNSATAFVLDPASPSLVPTLTPVGKRPQLAVKHTGSNRLLVVSAGEAGSAEKEDVPAQLALVDPSTTGELTTMYTLASRFGAVAQSEEGRFVVLYNTSSSTDGIERGLYNPNEMAVLDFTDSPTAKPISLTPKLIRSMGGVPASIRFSPVYSFAKAGEHRLAVVLSQNYVTLFDLFDLARPEISIPLCPTGAACNYRVDDVIFDPSNLSIYVRVFGARDIFQIVLTEPDVPDVTQPYVFGASLSLLAVGASPGDMVLYGTGRSARLAVAAPENKTLIVIDPSTGRSSGIKTAIPANRILPFTVPTNDPAITKNKAMLLDLQYNSGSVLVVDLGAVEGGADSEPRQYAISGVVSSAIFLPTQGIAILLFGRSASNAVLSVVKLTEAPSFFDFNSSSALGSPYIEVRNAGLSTRLWYVDSPKDNLPSPNSGVRFQDLMLASSEKPGTVWLDQAITSITALAGPSADGHRYLVLEQYDPDTYGDVTFVDADNPDRSTARTARGFLFADYLGRSQP